MAQYTLVDPATGQQTTLSEVELTRNLRLNYILLRDGEHIGIITHRDLVLFARWCAGEMLARLEGEPHQSVVHVLRLVDKWLEDQQSLTSEELDASAGVAWVAAHDALAGAQDVWDNRPVQTRAHVMRVISDTAQVAWAAAMPHAAAQNTAEAARNAAWYTKASYKVQAHRFVEQLCAENKKEQE